MLTRLARLVKREAVVWRCDANLSDDQQGQSGRAHRLCSFRSSAVGKISRAGDVVPPGVLAVVVDVRGNEGEFLASYSSPEANRAVCRASRHKRVDAFPNNSGIRASSGQRQGYLPIAIFFGWMGVDFRSEVESGSTLGQLGRLHPHDQTTHLPSGRHFDHRHLPLPGAVFRSSQEPSGHAGGSRVGDPIVEDVG